MARVLPALLFFVSHQASAQGAFTAFPAHPFLQSSTVRNEARTQATLVPRLFKRLLKAASGEDSVQQNRSLPLQNRSLPLQNRSLPLQTRIANLPETGR